MVNVIWTERMQHAFEDYVRLAKDTDSSIHDSALLKQVEETLRQSSTSPTPKEQEKEQEAIASPCTSQPPAFVDIDLLRKVSGSLLAYEKMPRRNDDGTYVTQSTETSNYWIHELLKGSGVYVPPPPPQKKNPELERILDEARAQIAAKEYDRMMDGITGASSDSGSLRDQMADLREFKSTLIAIANILYTGIAVFVAVYMLSKHVYEDIGMRFLLGFLGFILIVACESYLYYRHVTAEVKPVQSKSKRRGEESQTSSSYDTIKQSLHDEVMKAATKSSSTSSSTKMEHSTEEQVTTLKSPAGTTTTSVKTSTTATTKRRSKKAG
ncbi:hypothetical protein BGW42_002456 [Actinomortierella wolfii]|nr:hypothetical protein BGW42_002456 [Actinomortierella wolfii]